VAKNLFQTVNEQLTKKPAVTPQLGQTEQAQSLLRTKLGKANTSTGAAPRTSAVGEATAARQTQLGGEQLQQQGQVQAQQIQQQQTDLQAKEQENVKDILSKRADLKQNFDLTTENLLQDAERNRQRLDTDEYKAKMEQVGFNIRLGNKQYTDTLEREAANQRLDNDIQFKYAMADQIFKDEQETLEEFLDFQRLIDADERGYQEELSQMDDTYAYQIAELERRNAEKLSKYESFGKGGSAAASAYGNYDSNKSGAGESGDGATSDYDEAE